MKEKSIFAFYLRPWYWSEANCLCVVFGKADLSEQWDFICWWDSIFWLNHSSDSCFNMKMPSYQCENSHCEDKMILWLSYLHGENLYASKTSSNWIKVQLLSESEYYHPWWWPGDSMSQDIDGHKMKVMKYDQYIYHWVVVQDSLSNLFIKVVWNEVHWWSWQWW